MLAIARRSAAATVLVIAVAGVLAGATTTSVDADTPREPATVEATGPSSVSYRLPLAGEPTVLHPYIAPASPYDAGERGVDFAASAGDAVLAAGAGTVRFAGSVAGRGVVVLAHPDGITTEYEPVTPAVSVGQVVRVGDAIGSVLGVHAGCPPDACAHWGARHGSSYLDPMSLLAPLGVVRLTPWN